VSTTLHYRNYDTYKPADAWAICDRCGQRVRRSQLYVEWDNLRVDRKCLDPRPPQMQPPRVYPEGIPFPDARPPQDNPDRLTDDTALQSVTGGFIVAPPGQYHNGGQNQLPGALSPMSLTESVTASPNIPEPGQPSTIGTPISPNVLADDVTFITGRVGAPSNSNSLVLDPAPFPAGWAIGFDGRQWSFYQPAPTWLADYAVPSGDAPLMVADVAKNRYAVTPDAARDPFGPLFYAYSPNGNFDPVQDWIAGLGLQANSDTQTWPTFNQNIFALYPNVTLVLYMSLVPGSSSVLSNAYNNANTNGEGAQVNLTNAQVFSVNLSASDNSPNTAGVATPPYRAAISSDGSKLRMSLNGSPVVSLGKLSYPDPFNYWGLGLIQGNDGTPTVTAVVIYPTQSDSDLPAISTP